MARKFRCKTSTGISLSFTVFKSKDGFKISAGKARRGKSPIPLDFLPFEITNAIINGPVHPSEDAAEQYARSI